MIRARIPNVFFKRAITYLLHRYLGEYLEAFHPEDVFLSYNKGTCVLQKVAFKVEALNSLTSEHNVPLEFVEGTIDTVLVEVPWSSLFIENSVVEFKGVHLVVQPTKCIDDGSMLSSMWESVASSKQMAEECLLQKLNDAELEPFKTAEKTVENVTLMASALDLILSKLKVKFTDTFIRVESMLNNSNTGIALEVKIKSALLFDEAGVNAEFTKAENSSDQNSPAYCVKKIVLEGIELYSAQFTANNSYPLDQTQLIPGSPEMPPPHSSLPLPKTENADLQTEPILISRVNGQQQIRLKLKQNDSIVGPKVDIEINLGLITLFLTPFQIHTLLELMRGIATGGSDGKNHSAQYPSTVTNRPMKPEDFRVILEQALQKQNEKSNPPSKSLQNCHGWSSHSLDECEDVFHLLSGEHKMTSDAQPVTEDLESSCSGSSVGSERISCARTNLQNLLTDSILELTHIYACCGSLLVIVLHEDVVSNSANQEGLLYGCKTSKNFSFLKNRAEDFFNDMTNLTMEGVNMKNFDSVREKISQLCQSSHLRFLASGVTFECSEKTSSAQRVLSSRSTALDFEILECLFNASANDNVFESPTYTEIVSFHMKESSSADSKINHNTEPCIKMKWDRFESIVQRSAKQPPNKLSIIMAPVYIEVDMSLKDRIHSLFHPEFLISRKDATDPDASLFLHLKNEDKYTRASQRTEVNFTSNFVVINLRFPIPDLRPLHDMERVPWWKQNLRKESFIMELRDALLFYALETDQTQQKYEIQCRDFHGLFQMSENGPRISFMRVSVDPEVEKATQDKGLDWPRLVISRIPQKTMCLLDTHFLPDTDYSHISVTDILMSNISNELSPFSSNSVFCGSKLKSSDTSENSNDKTDFECDDDEIVMPAEKDKMDEFIDHVVNNSQLLFDFFIPTANANMPDKEFFELVCNRLFNDLVSWQPTPLNSFYTHEANSCKMIVPVLDLNPLRENDNFPAFYNCESNFNDSGSDSDEESGIYHSINNEFSMKHRQKQQVFSDNGALTNVAFLLTIKKGSLTIQAPIMDGDDHVMPDYCGKMHFFLEDCKFLSAAGYRGDKNQTYMCMMSNEVTLYHNGLVPFLTEKPIVQPYCRITSDNLSKIIYASEFRLPSTASVVGCGSENMGMLSLAIHNVNDIKQQIKTFKVAVSFSGTTLRHYMAPLCQLFPNQLTNFLNVTQQPVSGVPPSAMIMEFHLHLLDCAVDYRPLYLPLRTVLTVEHFSLSSNITKSASMLLRTISEELHLFISNDLTQKSVDLKKNYVCVVDTGLVDVSVRMTHIEGQPKKKFEMCASNNMIHVRTCSDSCQALQKLIIYVAGYGDFAVKENCKKNGEATKADGDFSSKNVAQVPHKVADSVQDMMVEAMKDFTAAPESLGAKSENLSDYSDEEFCILEDDPGVGLLPKNREPQIRVLTHDPIRIIENHFTIPSGKSDLLKAPKHFPESVRSNTLREMSITWHLYGGSDFAQPRTPEKKHVKIKDPKDSDASQKSRIAEDQSKVEIDAERNKIAFCKVTPLTREFDVNAVHFSMENITEKKSSNDVRSWIVRGGENRDHNVLMELQLNKVKFQHEVYPDDSEYVSRHVLLIHDIEIRDKLTSSMINKFLYQYSCESMPRQTHANMVVVKAVHVRPDTKLNSQECSLKVSCKPLRLHIDQDALMFLFDFFKEFAQDASSAPSTPSPSHDVEFTLQGNEVNFIPPPSPTASKNKANSNLTYFKSFSFSPEVLIRLDYHGKRVIMDQGALQGILMGLTQLNCSEIVLKRLSYRHGLLGSERLLSYAANEWLQDIKSNQLPSILGGIGPMHSFIQLFQGLKDLIWMPVVQYRRDGQIVRGLQRGASSFSTSTVSACLEITSRIVGAIQGAAEVAYDMVSPGPSVTNRVQSNYVGTRRTNQQPADVREGMTTAYNVVKEGFGDTVRTIARVASVEHEHKGICGAVGGVLRQIPPATVKPIMLGAEAFTIVLGGVKHQLVPDAHKEAMDKWRTKNN